MPYESALRSRTRFPKRAGFRAVLLAILTVVAVFPARRTVEPPSTPPPSSDGIAAVVLGNDGADGDAVTCLVLHRPLGVAAAEVAAAQPRPGVGPPKVLYLDFDGQVNLSLQGTAFHGMDLDRHITVPPFADSLAVGFPLLDPVATQAAVVAQVADDFAPFHVIVTDQLATAQSANGGQFERLYMGGGRDMFDNAGGSITSTTLGIAELDLGSPNFNNIGFVFVEHFGGSLNDPTLVGGLIGSVASHEAGHEQGLEHVSNIRGRMNPATTLVPTEILETWRAGWVHNTLPPKYQDSSLLLGQVLDLSTPIAFPDPTPDDFGDNFFDATLIDDPTAAGTVVVGGTVEISGDVDVMQFTASRTMTLTVRVRPAASLDAVLAVIDLDGNSLTVQDFAGDGADETGVLNVRAGQSYFVYVNGERGVKTGTYELRLEGEAPEIIVLGRSPAPGTVINRAAGVQTVQIQFNQPVSVAAVQVRGVRSGMITNGNLFGQGTDTWTDQFAQPLPDQDRYTVTVTAGGLVSEWEFTTLVGDCDGNARVDIFDLGRVRIALRNQAFDESCDIREDGRIDIFDLGFVRSAIQNQAAAP